MSCFCTMMSWWTYCEVSNPSELIVAARITFYAPPQLNHNIIHHWRSFWAHFFLANRIWVTETLWYRHHSGIRFIIRNYCWSVTPQVSYWCNVLTSNTQLVTGHIVWNVLITLVMSSMQRAIYAERPSSILWRNLDCRDEWYQVFHT